MINQTIDRIAKVFAKDQRFFVIPEQLIKITRNFVGKENMVVEPARKNTAPAICLAAMLLQEKFGDGIIHIMPADHLIRIRERFIKCLRAGENMAEKGFLVTYGIIPDRPETGYGYIRTGKVITTNKKITAYHGEGFTEKPSRKKAMIYIKTKRYLWNSGIFTYRISTVLNEIKIYIPEVYEGVCKYLKYKNKKYFEKIPAISIDYGVMEKSSRICVVKSDFGWDDVGTWLALERYFEKDPKNNIILGNALGLEIEDSIIYTYNIPLRIYGIKGLVVVASPMGVLVCKKERTPDLKKLFAVSFNEKGKRRS